MKHRTTILFLLLLSLHVSMLAWAICKSSATIDEVAHLPAGISNWQLGRFRLYHVNPPLVRMTAALPVVLLSPETDWSYAVGINGARNEFKVGSEFYRLNKERAHMFFIVARLACLPFSILGLTVCFAWARSLYGDNAGLLAAFLWSFSPFVLGHGSLITPDVAAAAVGAGAFFCFRTWLHNPTFRNALTFGAVAGCALVTKFTFVIVLPVTTIALFAVVRRHSTFTNFCRDARQLIVATLAALGVVNFVYGFEGTGTRLGDFTFHSQSLSSRDVEDGRSIPGNRFSDSLSSWIPIPVPREYLLGIDTQKCDFEPGTNHGSYLCGTWNRTGWWYYYLVALAVKVPVPVMLLTIVAVLSCGIRESESGSRHTECRHDQRSEILILLAPAFVIFLLVSSQTTFTDHARYVLPAFPFAFVFISRVAHYRLHKTLLCTVCLSLMCQVLAVFSTGPHWLSYFNIAAGGPEHGYSWLSGSNVDWGQDLLQLQKWQQEELKGESIYLLARTGMDPSDVGINFRLPDVAKRSHSSPDTTVLEPGWHAVGVQLLTGRSEVVYDENHSLRPTGSVNVYRPLVPTRRIGYSIHLYHIEPRQPQSDSLSSGSEE